MTAVKAGDVERAVAGRRPGTDVLLFYGPDAGRVNERARAAARGFVPDPDDALQLIRLDGDTMGDQPGRLVEEATTFGLFGGRRAIWLRAGQKAVAPALAPCLDVDLVDTLVVIEAGDLARNAPLRVLCEGSPRALALPCYGDEARDLGSVVTDTLAARGLTIGREARDLLIEHLGGDRLASRGELEKLALYCHGQSAVTVADVEACVSDVSGLDIDVVLDAAFTGALAPLESGLARLVALGSGTGSLAALGLRHALLLLAARARFDSEGGAIEIALRSWPRLNFRRRDVISRQIRRWPTERLRVVVADLQFATRRGRATAALADQLIAGALFRIAGTRL